MRKKYVYEKKSLNRFNLRTLFLLLGLGLTQCTYDKDDGVISVKVIQPAGGHCQYSINYADVATLYSLKEMRGKVGRVVFSDEDLEERPEILNRGEGLKALEVQFSGSGNRYAPLDLKSLGAISLYRSVESVYLMLGRIDSSADLANLTPTLADTSIIYEAKMTNKDGSPVTDNAAYQPYFVKEGGELIGIKNYIFSFPSEETHQIPLKFNHGIVAHEASHFVNWYLWRQNNTVRNQDSTTKNTFGALDEGMADYVGYMLTGDPGFFLCTFPKENRDLSVPKRFTQGMEIHAGGAVWAAAQYQIGNLIGHENNLRALLRMLANFSSCSSQNVFTMRSLASCHQRYLSSQTSAVEAVYQNAFGM